MDEKDQHERGLKLRVEMFGREAVEKRMAAFGDFGKPLQHIINSYAYGDVWSRTGLPAATKSLVMIGMMAASGHPNELRVHLNGAVKNGCTPEADPGSAAAADALLRHPGRQRGAPHRGGSAARTRQAVTARPGRISPRLPAPAASAG